MNPRIAKFIKITSTIAMTIALGLEGWNLYLHLQEKTLSPNLNLLFWIAGIALIAHGVEGAIAALKASSQNKNPVRYGIYTFFVGFVGLQELND